MEVSFHLGTTIIAAASVIYVAHSRKDFLLTQKRALTRTFQDYFFPDDYKKQMWEYARFAKNIEQEKGAKFCYPTGLLQAVLHRTYGYSFAEIMIIQKVLDWYLPRVKEKFYPTGLDSHLLPLQGQHLFAPITEKEHVTEEDLSNTRDMLALFVSALEERYQDIAILPERSPSRVSDQITEMQAFEQQCFETRSQRSPSRSSASDDTQSVIETELSEGVSDHEHVLHNLEPLEEQRQMWYEMSAHHLSSLAEKSSQTPQKAFHVVIMTELETTLSMSFIDKLLSRLEEISSNGLMFKLIIGVTYETPEQLGQRMQDLSKYLRQQITQRLLGNCPLLAERPLPISFVDMTVSEDRIRATFSEEFKADPCEQVVLILNPEQAAVYDHFKKMTDLDVLISILPRSPEEGSHPEHWLQALRQTFRLRDVTTRKNWSDYLAGQQDTSFSMTAILQQGALNNQRRSILYEFEYLAVSLPDIEQRAGIESRARAHKRVS